MQAAALWQTLALVNSSTEEICSWAKRHHIILQGSWTGLEVQPDPGIANAYWRRLCSPRAYHPLPVGFAYNSNINISHGETYLYSKRDGQALSKVILTGEAIQDRVGKVTLT